MAQVDYFMTDWETSRLLEELVEGFAARFTPQQNDTSDFPVIGSAEELIAREQDGHFRTRYFVTSSHWGLHPFKIEEFQHPVYHRFDLGLRYGGPYFDHVPSRFYAVGSQLWIVPGMFSDYASYYCSRGAADIPRPPEMAKAFRSIKRLLLKKAVRSRCVERGFVGPHISPGALEFFNNGGWLRIGDWHFQPLVTAG